MKTNPKFENLSKTYDKVEEEAVEIDKAQDGIRQTSVEKVLVIGELLWKAHDKLANYGDGVFNNWCKQRLKLKRTTAWKIMTVHDYFGADCSQCKQSYALSALYLLSRPSTPGRIRKLAKRFAAKGGKVSHWRVKLWLKFDQDEQEPKEEQEQVEEQKQKNKSGGGNPPPSALDALIEAWARATDEEREKFDEWRKQLERPGPRRPRWLKRFETKHRRKFKDERKVG